MARINVDDDFWTHPRYRYLVRLVGDEDKATGMCLRAWRIAQKFWAKRQTIPFEVWDLENLESMVTAGLAIRREEGVYCRGSKTHFEWYSQRVDAARKGGIKSVETRTEKFGTAQPPGRNLGSKQNRSNTSIESNQDRTTLQSESNPPALDTALTLDKNSPNGESLVVAEADDLARVPFKAFAQTWLDHAAGLKPKTKVELSDERKRKIRARWKERPDLSYWATCAQKMGDSTFCQESAWATFDWLIKNGTNHVKVSDGNYDDQGASSGDEYWSKINWDAP